MASKAKAKDKEKEPQSESELASQLHEVKLRASDQEAELLRRSRTIKQLQKDCDELEALREENEDLKEQLKVADAQIKHLENEVESQREYANANEGDAKKLQQIKDALV